MTDMEGAIFKENIEHNMYDLNNLDHNLHITSWTVWIKVSRKHTKQKLLHNRIF